jgi:uncharacterized protein (TIGR02453 family)
MSGFSGFPQQALPYLQKLARNNRREWFNEHKQEYETYVREPALAFIQETAPKLKTISDQFHAIAKKSGGSLMRVYRDTRFSKDKTPYKTNIGIQFRHVLGKDVHAPGFYLHIEHNGCFIGAGIWHPESKTLAKIRNFIVDNPSAWQTLRQDKKFNARFELAGESLVRAPKGFTPEHPLIEDLKRKDYIAIHPFDCSQINQAKFSDFVIDGFRCTDQFMRYLCAAIEVNY